MSREWVTVPAEPTPEMVEEICRSHTTEEWPNAFGASAQEIRRDYARAGWAAALAAAPHPPIALAQTQQPAAAPSAPAPAGLRPRPRPERRDEAPLEHAGTGAQGMTRELTLTLPYPISANRYWATRVIKAKATGRYMAMTYVTPEAKAYRDQVALIARAAGLEQPLVGRVAVELDLYPHRPQDWARRARRDPEAWDDDVQCIDLGNCEKVLSDALQGIVFPDDRWIWSLAKDRKEPDGEGRVVLRVRPLVRKVAAQPALEMG